MREAGDALSTLGVKQEQAGILGRLRARLSPKDVHPGDRIFASSLQFIAFGTLVLLLAIAAFLGHTALPALKQFGWGFLRTSTWDPVQDIYGALPVIFGTLVSSALAVLIAAPLSVAVALFLTELAPPAVASLTAFLVQMLAAIPSVVYGLWGVFVLAPWLRSAVEPLLAKTLGRIPLIGALFQGPAWGVGMLSAGIILAIMITPTIASIAREVFSAIPRAQRESALALGATRWETMRISVLHSSSAGIFGAVILGLGRALGETMAVTMVIGNRAAISASLFAPAQTMASVIANEYAEATGDMHISALAAIGVALFGVTFVLNSLARIFIRRVTRSARIAT